MLIVLLKKCHLALAGISVYRENEEIDITLLVPFFGNVSSSGGLVVSCFLPIECVLR